MCIMCAACTYVEWRLGPTSSVLNLESMQFCATLLGFEDLVCLREVVDYSGIQLRWF